MSVTRNELYQQVWTEPMTTVAATYCVSSSFLARVCARLKFRVRRAATGRRLGLVTCARPLPHH